MSAEVEVLMSIPMRSYEEWELFDTQVTLLIQNGLLRRIDPLRVVHRRSEEWFVDQSDGEMYVYLKPDDKIYPSWERIDPFAAPADPNESRNLEIAGLRLIKEGDIQRGVAVFLRKVLDDFAMSGRIELLKRGSSLYETWCREFLTDNLYRLTINDDEHIYRWDRVGQYSVEEVDAGPN